MNVRRYRHNVILFLSLIVVTVLSSCNGTEPSFGPVLGRDEVSGPAAPIPQTTAQESSQENGEDGQPIQYPQTTAVPAVGESCHSNNQNKICLALKYVTYKDPTGEAIINEQQATANLAQINAVWQQCDIGFQVDSYLQIEPTEYKLRYQTADNYELDDIRDVFFDDSTLLVATTGSWDRSGSLGGTGANAWTSMPGSPPYGAILERPVSTHTNIIAHELGHYLNLLHANDGSALMNPIVYQESTKIYDSDCETARAAATHFWPKMLR
ncbi:MAG: matrixin family metalloprotease [Bdellovibrionota bacterium]